MKTGNTQKLVELAISHWMSSVGAGSLQPNQALCTLAPNGTVWLKNVNGHIGFVTKTGKCFVCVGGERLDEITTNGRA